MEIPDEARLQEIANLIETESSVSFYSHRAKESMLMLLAEAHRAAAMRQRITELECDARVLNALRSAGVDNWEGYGMAMEGLRD